MAGQGAPITDSEVLRQILEVNRATLAAQLPRVGTMEDFQRLVPPTFSGTEGPQAAEQWLRKVGNKLKVAKVPDVDKVDMAQIYLEGFAHDWWEAVEAEHEVPLTWAEFQTRFLARFFPAEVRKDLEYKFSNLVQDKMSVADYNAEFIRLSRFAGRLVATDEDRKERFVRGLRRELRKDMLAHDTASYDQCVVLATRHESLSGPVREVSVVQKRPFEAPGQSSGAVGAKRPQYAPQQIQYAPQQLQFAPQQQYVQQRPQVVCSHCHRSGHVAEQCRAALGLCFACGQPGHQKQQCPNRQVAAPFPAPAPYRAPAPPQQRPQGFAAPQRLTAPAITQPRPAAAVPQPRGPPL